MGFKEDFENTPLWQKIVLGLLAVVLVFGGLKNYVIKDKPRQVKQLRRKVRRIEGDIFNKKTTAQDYALVLKQHATLQSQISEHLPGLQEMVALLSELIATAESRKISFTLVQPGSLVDESAYWQFPVTLNVQGRMPNIAGFLSQLEQSMAKNAIRTLDVRHLKQDLYQADIFLATLVSKETEGRKLPPVALAVPPSSTSPPQRVIPSPVRKTAPLVLDGRKRAPLLSEN